MDPRTSGRSTLIHTVALALAWHALSALTAQCAEPADPPAPTSSGQIRWRIGTAVTTFQIPTDVADVIMASPIPGTDTHHLILQFDATLARDQRQALERAGLNLLSYLGDHAYFASFHRARMDVARLAGVRSLRASLPVERRWKLHPILGANAIPTWAIVGEDANPTGRVESPASDTMVAVCVLFHRDVPLVPSGVNTVLAHRADVVSKLRSVNGLVIEISWENMLALADQDIVQWIEPPLPNMEAFNDSNRARVQANLVQAPWDRRRWDRPRCCRKGPCGAKAALALRRTRR